MRRDVEAISKFADDIRRSGGGEGEDVSHGEAVLYARVAGRAGNSKVKAKSSNMVPTMPPFTLKWGRTTVIPIHGCNSIMRTYVMFRGRMKFQIGNDVA